jgi:hypothetical protein
MAQATFATLPNALGPSRVRRPSPRLGKAMSELRKAFKGLFDPYRPELHYMRGPGPKWREKHGNLPYA